MLFSGLDLLVASTSKLPLGKQGPGLAEHPLSWGSCVGSRLMLYSAGVCSGATVDSGSPSLYSKRAPSVTLTRAGVCGVSQLWDEEQERVLRQSLGTVPQAWRLSCCVTWDRRQSKVQLGCFPCF